MRTKEIVERYGISKETLRYYEKVNLISPDRDDNGYRHYQKQDILMIETIIQLRQLDISVEQIHMILDGKLSLFECLQNQEKYIQGKIHYYEKILIQIQSLITRQKIDFVFNAPQNSHEYLMFNDDYIMIHQAEQIMIAYEDIEKCVLSMCSRQSSQKSSYFFAPKNKYQYHLDIDIVTKEKTYQFESTDLKDVKKILERLEKKVHLVDDLNLKNIFNQTDYEIILQDDFPKWASLYHLDHPRHDTLETMSNEFDNVFKKGRKSVMKCKEDLKKIEGSINYHSTDRLKVNFALGEGSIDELVFTDEMIAYKDLTISYNSIQRVTLSMCSRIYNPGVMASGPLDFIVKSWQKGSPFVAGIVNLVYSMDLDIETDGHKYAFESTSLDDMEMVIGLFHKHEIEVNDPIGIEKILNHFPEQRKRQQFFEQNFSKLSKKYNLDNPRGTSL